MSMRSQISADWVDFVTFNVSLCGLLSQFNHALPHTLNLFATFSELNNDIYCLLAAVDEAGGVIKTCSCSGTPEFQPGPSLKAATAAIVTVIPTVVPAVRISVASQEHIRTGDYSSHPFLCASSWQVYSGEKHGLKYNST